MSKNLTLSELTRVVRTALQDHAIDDAELESRFIIENVTGLTSAERILGENEVVSRNIETKVFEMMNRRLDGEPLDHIFGYKEFYGLKFEINRHVLSPRPETEMLVDFILSRTTPDQAFEILDLGTGSGAIAITVLASRPKAKAIATDICPKALSLARRNADLHNVVSRLSLVQGYWAEALSGSFDFIVSNPPYIDAHTMNKLSREVREYDPTIALLGGEDGLAAYRIIIKQAKALMKSHGKIAVEIGFDQGETVSLLFKNQGYQNITLKKDLAGRDRVIVADATD